MNYFIHIISMQYFFGYIHEIKSTFALRFRCTVCFVRSLHRGYHEFALEGLDLILNNIIPACNDQEAMNAKLNMQIESSYGVVAITASGTTVIHALSYPL